VAQFSEQAPSISETYDTQSRSLYANSKLLSLFISLEIDCFYSSVSALLMTLMWKELVNALAKVVGFLRVLRFPPTGNVDRVGWD
jgi:hypothetical protein